MELNEKNLRIAQPGDILRDAVVKGLHVKVSEGRKAFYLYFRTKTGKERRPKLGDYGTITLSQARDAARSMMTTVARGEDPITIRKKAIGEKTVQDLWDRYWRDHGSRKKTGWQDELNWRLHLAPRLAKLKLSEVEHEMVSDIIADPRVKPYAANRSISLLSTMFNFGIEPLRWATINPCRKIRRHKESKRSRYMQVDEAAKISEILERELKTNTASAAFIYLLIFTGARKGEIANATWSMISEDKIILKEHKTDYTGDARVIHLPQAAKDILALLPRTNGTITGLKYPRKFWNKVITEAGCPDLHMHDLRHSFASAGISAGLSLAQIGALLGHRSAQTTLRYAHLVDETAKTCAAAAADQIALRMRPAV